MKKRGKKRIIVIISWSVSIVVAVTLFLMFSQKKQAIKVTYAVENTTLEARDYQSISLLCRKAQMTNVWFVAIAIKENDGIYKYLNQPIDLYVTGNDPFSTLNTELTIYSNNHFILHGDLGIGSINNDAPGYLLDIKDWDIVYPIKTTLRPFFMRRFIYSFDYK